MARRPPDKSPLVTRPPFPGTAYWACPTNSCRGLDGERTRWPLHVYLGRGKSRVSKTAVCPRCGCRRSMTGDETALYEEILPAVEREITLATKLRERSIDPHAMRSYALMAACDAAMMYDPRIDPVGKASAVQIAVRRARRELQFSRIPDRERQPFSWFAEGFVENVLAPNESEGPEAIDLDELFLQADVNERDREFLSLRFGLTGEPAMTFDQVAAHFRLPKKRAVEWQAELFERMRQRCRIED